MTYICFKLCNLRLMSYLACNSLPLTTHLTVYGDFLGSQAISSNVVGFVTALINDVHTKLGLFGEALRIKKSLI